MLLLLSVLIFSCGNNPAGVDKPIAVSAFDDDMLEITATPAYALTERPIVLSVMMSPKVTGVGHIAFRGQGETYGGSWVILSPMHDTVSSEDQELREYGPVAFTAGEDRTVSFQMQLLRAEPHHFNFYAIMDSIYIADSNRMFYVDSPAAIAVSGSPVGYYVRAAGIIDIVRP